MAAFEQQDELSLAERAENRVDVRADLLQLEQQIAELKVLYEQYFVGLLPLAPDKQHSTVKASIRKLRKAPFRNSALNFQLRTLEHRYQTFNNYWQRVLKQKEDGTYSRDLFRADLHEQMAADCAFQQSDKGAAQQGFQALFSAYKNALERQTGKVAEIDYNAFQQSLIKRARDLKAKLGVEKLSFSVSVKNGKVLVKARAKGA